MNNISDWFKIFSTKVWNRLHFSYNVASLSCNETTLTENLLFEFYRLGKEYSQSIQLYESKDERINGSDMELFVECQEGFVCMPIQAKRLYPSGKYEKIKYKNSEHYQIDALLEYSKKVKGLPLYLFYNYNYHNTLFEFLNETIPKHYFYLDDIDSNIFASFPYELFGCTIADASKTCELISEIDSKIPKFDTLHCGTAVPLYMLGELACGFIDLDHFQALIHHKSKLKYYPKSFVENEGFWRNITPPTMLGGLPNERETIQSIPVELLNDFQPKYRLVLYKTEELKGVSISVLS